MKIDEKTTIGEIAVLRVALGVEALTANCLNSDNYVCTGLARGQVHRGTGSTLASAMSQCFQAIETAQGARS